MEGEAARGWVEVTPVWTIGTEVVARGLEELVELFDGEIAHSQVPPGNSTPRAVQAGTAASQQARA